MLKYLNRKQINTSRWDEVIASSPAETLYAYSWYLDTVAANWSALVMDDYRFIMPLIWKRKFALRYIYQPFYTQQLGVFSREYVDPTLIQEMLSLLTGRYRFATLNFNTKNLVGEIPPFTVDDKTNYVLDLRPGYEQLADSFSTNARRNIKKALDLDTEVRKDLSVEGLVDFKRHNDVIKRTEEEYQWLITLLNTISAKSKSCIFSAMNEDKTIAAAFFGFSRSRAIYLVSASSELGKEDRSMFKIVNEFIREHAGSELILDFEGSNIPNVARFFAGFGARPEIYQGVSYFRLPRVLKRLRKNGS